MPLTLFYRLPLTAAVFQGTPAWYVLLKVCLPSTLGLIKEPALLEKMYSRAAMVVKGRGTNSKRVRKRKRVIHVAEGRCE